MRKAYIILIVLVVFLSNCKSCEEALKEEIGKSEIKGVIIAKYSNESEHNLPILEVQSTHDVRRLILYECYGDKLWHSANVGDSLFKAYNSYKIILSRDTVRQEIDLTKFNIYY